MTIKWLVTTTGLMCTLSCLSVAAAPCQDLSQLKWILGNWTAKNSQHTTVENWKAVSESTFEGIGISITPNTMHKESMRLVSMSEQVFFIAKVPGNELPVAFSATTCNTHQARFENLQHDFPTSLEYRLKSKRELLVKVRGAKGKGFDILFAKQTD